MAKTILTKNQIKLLNEITKNTSFSKYFYLTGGTALSEFYLHHRLSDDLDFFSEQEIDRSWLTSLVSNITSTLDIQNVDRRTLFNRNLVFFNFKKETIKTEFTYFPSPQIEKPLIIKALPIDSLIDIAVNKFFTIYQKPEARHLIDLYLILMANKFSWNQLKKLARIKFDTNIDPIQLGSSLIKSQTITDFPRMLIPLDHNKWQNYYLKKAKELEYEIKKT